LVTEQVASNGSQPITPAKALWMKLRTSFGEDLAELSLDSDETEFIEAQPVPLRKLFKWFLRARFWAA
jgi:hypothetical protein